MVATLYVRFHKSRCLQDICPTTSEASQLCVYQVPGTNTSEPGAQVVCVLEITRDTNSSRMGIYMAHFTSNSDTFGKLSFIA